MFGKNKVNYSQSDIDKLEDKLREQKQRNDELDAEYKQSVASIKLEYADRNQKLEEEIKFLRSQPAMVSNDNWDTLVSTHTFRRGGSVFIHGQDMTLWECVDGCSDNPQARTRLVLPNDKVVF